MVNQIEIKKKVFSECQRYLKCLLDNKTMNYWIHEIENGNKTFADFEKILVKNEHYRETLYSVFRQYYIDLIGMDVDDSYFNTMIESCNIVRLEDVLAYVQSLPPFHEKYEGMIKHCFDINGKTCNPEIIQFYLSKFVQNHNDEQPYDFEKLQNDIKKENTSEEIILFNTQPKEANANNLLPLLGSHLYDKKIVEEFEAIFKRPMFVQEYFKYVVGNKPWDLAKHTFDYNEIRNLYEIYGNTKLNEYTYVKQYLDVVERTNYKNEIIDNIVDSKEYETTMKSVLKQTYKSLFGEDLETQDIDYIFKKVKSSKIGVVSDEIHVILTDLKIESDTIVSNIFNTYQKVIERDPDVHEMDTYIEEYRISLESNKKFDVINDNLEKILMKSLEFHDIIKKKIKVLYKASNGKEILPSKLFTTLSQIASQVSNFSMSSMDDFITQRIA